MKIKLCTNNINDAEYEINFKENILYFIFDKRRKYYGLKFLITSKEIITGEIINNETGIPFIGNYKNANIFNIRFLQIIEGKIKWPNIEKIKTKKCV